MDSASIADTASPPGLGSAEDELTTRFATVRDAAAIAQGQLQSLLASTSELMRELTARERALAVRASADTRTIANLRALNAAPETRAAGISDADASGADPSSDHADAEAAAAAKLQRVRLNVGGRHFETTRGVLCRHRGSIFDMVLSDDFHLERDETGSIFFDRDPEMFEELLRYLRGDVVPAAFMPVIEGDVEAEGAVVLVTQHAPVAASTSGASGAAASNSPGGGVTRAPSAGGGASSNSAAPINRLILPLSFVSRSVCDEAAVAAGSNAVEEEVSTAISAPVLRPTVVAGRPSHVAIPAATAWWGAYSLAQRREMLRAEAEYFGIDRLARALSPYRFHWTAPSQTAPPSPRCFATMTTVGSATYLFGGCSATDDFYNELYRLVVDDGSALDGAEAAAFGVGDEAEDITKSECGCFRWERCGLQASGAAPRVAPSPRSGHTAVPVPVVVPDVGGAPRRLQGMLVWGGNGSNSMATEAWVVTVHDHTWHSVRERGTVPPPRSGHTMTALGDGRLIVVGGKRLFPRPITYQDVYVGTFDPAALTITWARMAVGETEADVADMRARLDAATSAEERASLDQGPFAARAYHTCVWYGGCVWMYGGVVANIYTNELWSLNPATGVCRCIDPALHRGTAGRRARSGHSAAVVDGRMYVCGSYADEDFSVDVFNFKTFAWVPLKHAAVVPGAVPTRRAALGAAVTVPSGNRLPLLVLFGGFNMAAKRCMNDLHALVL